MRGEKRRLLFLIIGSVVGMGVVLGGIEWLCFPSTYDYKDIITGADSIVIRFYVESFPAGGMDVLTLSRAEDKAKLAASFRITGIWIPLDELIGNSCRLRCRQGSEYTDITIRGGRTVRKGIWHARIDGTFLPTIVKIVNDYGKGVPTFEELLSQRPLQNESADDDVDSISVQGSE